MTFEIPETMKAMMLTAYDHLELREVPVPKPGPGEVLCRIKSVAICGSDPKMIHGGYAFTNWPPYYPFIMGHEWAGQVVALGEGVEDFQVGDRVAGEAHHGCGHCENCKNGHYTVCLNYGKDGLNSKLDTGHRHYGFYWQGANAEYNVYKTGALCKIADNVSYDVASMCDTAGVAMHGVLQAGVTPGGTSVVFGPGPIGLCAMMECKALGSGRVIMIGRGAKLEKARELGADVCIDFTKEDVVARVLELTNGIGADEVMECSGADDSPYKACQMVRKAGHVALIANYHDPANLALPMNTVVFNEVQLHGSKANPGVSKMVLDFFASGKINGEALVSHTFPLEDYEKAVDIFEHKKDNSVKVVINP
ncbi:MAG: alcohol dehydrogenase catalytic domain-containing protein [Lachnospiraceae bacterium]|nr:alcohol dehydrogenase catalytic domain-containing protein [Lachnospiraceae bacterium]